MCSAQNTFEELLKLGDACSFNSDSCNQKAIDYYTKAIGLNSRCSECYYARATRKRRLNCSNNEIVFDFKKAIEYKPTELKYYKELAFYYYYYNSEINLALKNCYLALKYFNNTYDNESISIVLNIIAQATREKYGEEKSFELTINILDSLIITNPINLFYYEERAEKKYWYEDYEGALADFLYINKNYNDVEILKSIASCYNLLSNYFEAIQYYNKVIKIMEGYKNNSFSNLSYIYQARGECKSSLKDDRGAILDYEKAISINSNGYYKPRVYNYMAYSKMQINDLKGALISLNKAIEDENSKHNNDDTAYSYYLLGFVKNSLNDKEGACIAWSKSGELGNPNAYIAIQKNCK